MSIQDRAAQDRVSGHLATGILVDGDLVLIPAPPDSLFERDREIEVLVFPKELHEHSRVDAIDCRKLIAFTVEGGRGRPTAMTAKLAHHSTYAAQIGSVNGRELASRLDESVDLWRALDELDAIPRGIREIDRDLLAAVARVEREQRQPHRASHEYESHAEMTGGWCIFFCFCSPHRSD